jgi:hypothetical protein
MSRASRGRFASLTVLLALLVGFAVAHRVIFEPGVVGLLRDWAVPPSGAQVVAVARQVFDGWYRWGLGFPVVYITDYPLEFASALVASLGVSGAILSKAIVVLGPALAFSSAVLLGRQLGMPIVPAYACGIVYGLNPVVLNKLVAGQQTYVLGYALFPLCLFAYARAVTTGRWFWGGVATGASLALAGIQLQLGLIGVCVLAVASVTFVGSPLGVRMKTLAIAIATLGAIELPALIGVALNAGAVIHGLVDTRRDIAWVGTNSVRPLEALKLAGYVTQYDVLAVGRWYGLWSVAAYVVASTAFIGILKSPAPVRAFSLATAAVALAVVSAFYSPLQSLFIWVYEHVIVSQAFREVYDSMLLLALVYALGVGFFFASVLRGTLPRVLAAAPLLALAIFVSPLLSGDCGGQLVAHAYDAELSAAYDRLAGERGRITWLPMDQPLSFRDSGAGGEPMANTEPGSLWRYALSWPLTAVAMDVRSSDWSALLPALEALSVSAVVDRSEFRSELWNFVAGGPGTHYYLERTVRVPRLSTDAFAIGKATRVNRFANALPIAFSARGIAIVPRRLAAIGAVERSGFVPVAYEAAEASAVSGVPYVMLRDPGDEDDEALAVAGFDGVALPSLDVDARSNFASLSAWWWYQPTYGDIPQGVIAVGAHHYEVSSPRRLADGRVVVAWGSLPVGGRFRIALGNRARDVDTNGPAASWRSAALNVGPIAKGATVTIDSLDAEAAVAVRAVRFVESHELRRARASYATLLHNARAVVPLAVPLKEAVRGFRALRSGGASDLGRLRFGVDYRLELSYFAPASGSLVVRGPRGNPIAFARLAKGGHAVTLGFPGIDGAAAVVLSDGAVRRWTLGGRAAADVQRATRSRVAPLRIERAELSGTRAVFRDPGRVVVLNVAYGDNWTTSDSSARHFPSALGTNVWTLSGTPPSIVVSDAQTPFFHAAYVIGSCILACGLVALTRGVPPDGAP